MRSRAEQEPLGYQSNSESGLSKHKLEVSLLLPSYKLVPGQSPPCNQAFSLGKEAQSLSNRARRRKTGELASSLLYSLITPPQFMNLTKPLAWFQEAMTEQSPQFLGVTLPLSPSHPCM